jgi:hypothetical protein
LKSEKLITKLFYLSGFFPGGGAFSSVSLRNQFMETQLFHDLISESVFETPSSRCSSADTSLEGSSSPFPTTPTNDYCTSPDSSTNNNNNHNSSLQAMRASDESDTSYENMNE